MSGHIFLFEFLAAFPSFWWLITLPDTLTDELNMTWDKLNLVKAWANIVKTESCLSEQLWK